MPKRAELGPSFVAFDFETANTDRGSACALALAVVEGGRITTTKRWLINPETDWFQFSYLHHIKPEDVEDEPTFGEIWPEVRPFLKRRTLAAHNASFDLSVLDALCDNFGISYEPPRAICTVKVARAAFGLRVAKLPVVCSALGIALRHHDPVSDSMACAGIALAASREVTWKNVLSMGSVRHYV